MEKKGSFFRKKTHKILFVISILFLISTFFTHAATRTLNGGTVSWDNNNFLNQTFWNDNPSSGDIIKALYGDGNGGINKTAYTTKRLTGYCDTTTMQVINIADDTELHTMLTTSGYILMTNTIYVFNSGTYTLSPPYPTQMTMNNCTAIIGNGNVVIKAVGGGWFNNPTALISMGANYNAIIDNITLDGNGASLSFGIETDWTNNSTVNSVNVGNDIVYGIRIANVSHHNIFNNIVVHDIRNYAIFVRDWGYNNIISNCTVYNAGQRGIIIYDHGVNNIIENCNVYNDYYGIMVANNSTNNIIRNIDIHNNTYGVYVDTTASYNTLDNIKSHNNINAGIYFGNNSSYGIINNSQSYNNGNNGTYISSSSNIVINNSQSYNNTGVGIYFISSSSGVINNSQSYNNTSNGINLSSSSFGVINNTESYNNNGYGIYFASSAAGVLNNIGSYNNGTYGVYLDGTSLNTKYYGNNKTFANTSSGISGTVANLTTGNDGLVGRSNGIILQTYTMSRDYITNPLNASGNYFLNWSGSFVSLRGVKGYTSYTSGYSNGSGTLLQVQPVIYSGTTLINSGNFDTTKYIGSDLIKVTGELLGLPAATTGVNFTVTGNSTNGNINNYSLFGDINNFSNTLGVGTATGITLIAGDGQKRIITQLLGSNYFATHFEQVSFIDTTKPSQVTLIYPSSGMILNTGNISLVRSSAIDTGLGISGYYFEIVGSNYSGFVTTTGINIVGLHDGNYQWYVYAVDNIGNTGLQSTTGNFIINLPSQCMSGWNNDNFLTTGFWNNSPSDNNIICALYGSGGSDTTAYTNSRTSNTCNPNTMSVNYIDPGTNILPEYLTGNTIYVLFSGSHITARTINLTGCSAIVGSGDITISSNTPLTITGTLYASSKNNIIIDGISINGRLADRVGISFYLSHYNTLHNIHVYNYVGREACGIKLSQSWYDTLEKITANNNTNDGIYLETSSYNTINNSEFYNNYNGVESYGNATYNSINNVKAYNNHHGLMISVTNHNTINNAETYNNNGYGIVIYNGDHNTTNNINTYNNLYGGISITMPGGNNTVNNIQAYNNGQYGIDITDGANNNIINNIKTYGNNIAGIHNDINSYNNKFYGSLNVFSNTTGIIDSYVGGGFITGSSGDFPNILSGGILDTSGIMSRDYISNPINTIGEYMLLWTGSFASIRGNISYIGSTVAYSYGSGILLQKQPVIYSGTDIIASGTFDTTKYIGSNTKKYTGSLLGISTNTNTTGFSVTGIASNSFINNYSLFGNIVSYKIGQGINTSTGIYITTGDGIKRIITQIYSGGDFATHFETTSILDTTTPIVTLNGSGIINNMIFSNYTELGAVWSDNGVTGNVTIISGSVNTGVGGIYILEYIYSDGVNTASAIRTINIINPCMSGWNNDNFLNSGFWNNNPTTGNIICALYGNGTGDRTAYTQNWSGRNTTQCSGMNMNVIYIGQITFNNLAVNTIYVVTGSSTIKSDTNSIQINDCSAVVSNNSIGTKIYSTNTMTYSMIGPYTNKKYGIIDSIDIDGTNNGAGGSHAKNSCGLGANIGVNSVTVNNMKIYNTNVGICLSANGILINNTQIYNNGSYGISIFGGGYNTINNTQIYNNSSNGIIIFGNSNYNTINNSQSYNNGRNNCGISIFSGQWNIINNTQIYNNHYGLCIYTPNNTIHKMDIYNNGNSTRVATGATNIKFYGQNKFFNNLETDSSPGSGNLSTGSSSDYAGLSRSNGSFITTGIMSWDYITNPINGSGNYFLPWTSTFTGIIGTGNLSTTQPVTYSYGSGILMQTQPVIYSGTTLITGGIFDSTKYIGSDTTKLIGSLSGIIPTITNSTGIYTVQPLASIATGYTLLGNILGTPYTNMVGVSTGITLTPSDGQKNIITQLYSSTNFATHFQTTTFLDQTSPTFDFNNVGGSECISGAHLTITYATDTGAGLGSTPYSFDGSTWTGNAIINIPAQQPGSQTRTGRVRDSLGNLSYKIATFTFSDTLPTANNFTGNTNVSDTPKTADWIIQSNIQEGIKCGSTDISYSGMVTQATKGVCTVSGSNITYTPNTNQTGTDSCTIQAKDNENNTVNIIVYRENIDTTPTCLSLWNNDNFITGNFWNTNPTDECIIEALYGTTGDTNTAYTNLRSGYVAGSCLPSMTVLKTNNIPNNLTANTIYVLTGQNSIITGTINLNNCNAIISNTTGGTTFFITGRIVNNIILKNQSKQYTIIDNIATNGKDDGYGGTHTGNDNGIAFLGATNNTVNNSKAYYNRYGISLSSTERTNIYNSETYNNGTYGIVLGYSLYNQVINTKIYNNYYGIFIQSNSHRNALNNCQVYNNILYGIILERGADYNIINNSQSYNNLDGIALGSANYTVINNTQLYNNEYGLETNGTGTILNDVKMYNNKRAINIFASGAVIFYGNNDVLSPIIGNIANITTGYATDTSVIGVGRTNGSVIFSGNISRDRFTNPINTSGNYLLARSYIRSNLWNYKIGYADTITQGYSYGSGTLLQKQPVIYSGTTLVPGGTFNPTKYIGSNTTKYTGSLLGISTNTNITGFSVTGIANNNFISNYSLFGEIISYKIGQGINTSTGIYITTGDGIKRIITQIYSGGDFATHFETTSILDTTTPIVTLNGSGIINVSFGNYTERGAVWSDNGLTGNVTIISGTVNTGVLGTYTLEYIYSDGLQTGSTTRIINVIDPCMSSRNNDNFLTTGFWNNNPNANNIICALYGNGSGDTTAYTNSRTSNTCNPSSMSVTYITTGTDVIPEYFTGNTIYVLLSGSHITSRTINFTGCSAIVGSGITTIYSNNSLNTGMIYAIGKNNIIIDGITINGTGGGIVPTHQGNAYGILIASDVHVYDTNNYNTINNITTYNNAGAGVAILWTNYNLLNNIYSYNNGGAGIYSNFAGYLTINNSHIHDNSDGIYCNYGCTYNTIDTAEIYNNNYNISLYGSNYNTVKNIITYNGRDGISIVGGRNNLNNIQAYNNARGIEMEYGGGNTLNNTQIYNNTRGISVSSNSTPNIINNTQIYNNTQGIQFNTVSGNVLNNVASYNNDIGLNGIGTNTNNKFYGSLKLFGNITGEQNSSGNGFTIGSGSDFPGIFNDGILDTGTTMSRDYITNPINTLSNYMFSWTGMFVSFRRQTYTGPTSAYSYGSGILLQTQPIIYSGTDIIFSGIFNPTKYIGSDTIKVTGEFLGITTAMTGFNFTVTGNSFNGNISKYNLFGNITNIASTITIGTQTGITFTAGDGQKRVITQLFGTPYFATHFETNTVIDTTAPTFIFANNSGYECIIGTLNINSAIDTGIGLDSAPYSFDGINRGINTNVSIPAQHTGSQTKIGRVKDSLGNRQRNIATYTFNDTLPTANNFTGSTNVSSGSKTGDWKTLSAATDGACGNSSIYYSGIVSQGSKGICSILGDIITYTPNVNQTGSDSCTIQIKDNENNITNIVVGRENINSIYCSDGIVNGTEQCDDGNLLTGDGCSNICTRETPTCTLIATPNSGSIPLAIGVSGTKSSRAGYSGWDAGNGYINNFTGLSTYTYTGVGTFTITAYVYNNNNPTTTGSCTTTIQSNNSIYIVQAWPEKRSQTTAGTTLPNFRMTGAKVGIYSGHILLYTGILSLGWGGTGELGISTILSGTYNITFEGESHARSMLSGIVMNPGTRIIDFTTGNNVIGAIFSNAFGQFNPYTGYYQYAGDFGTPDLTKDETIMGADYSALVPYILVPFSPNYGLDKFDLNADGVYNSSDVDIIISHWITSTSGHGVTSGGWISF